MAGETFMTKTDAALLALRQRIRAGQLPPGAKVEAGALAAELDMSLTPVREALRVLSADGLVEMLPHRGAMIADTSSRDEEVWQLRALLEPRALELAVPHLVGDQLKRVERLHSACMRSSRHPAHFEKNREWHFAIYEPCAQPILLAFVRRLWEVLPWRTVWAIPGRSTISAREHDEVMAAIREGDAISAAAAMRHHILSARRSVEAEERRSPNGRASAARVVH